jgi:hypothetical protein
MPAGNNFTIRVILPEDCEKEEVARTLAGWGQVTSFGQTIFSKRVSGEEGVKLLSLLNSLGIEYSLSIDDATRGDVQPSKPVLVGSGEHKTDLSRPMRQHGTRPRSSRMGRAAGWSVGTLALVLLVALTASVMTADRGGAPAAVGSLGLYEDTFIDNRYGWTVNETADIDSGHYLVRNSGSAKSVLIANERLAGRNLIAEVEVTLIGGEKERFAGLGYRIRNMENFYFFGVSLDGTVAVLKRELGFWNRLEPGGGIRRSPQTPELKNRYHLRMVSRGLYSEFYIDGKLLTIVRDESFGRGLFGFYVDRNLDAAFDDLVVTFSEYESFDTDVSAGGP